MYHHADRPKLQEDVYGIRLSSRESNLCIVQLPDRRNALYDNPTADLAYLT